MANFDFYNPTQIYFGKGQIKNLGREVLKHGKRVLFVYGKGSIKKNGVYDAVIQELNSQNLSFVELGGVDPNPRISTVREGARLCREQGLDFVEAVGGGSAIDCAKGIAAAANYEGDAWDFWIRKAAIQAALPVGSALTISATGSEMNSGSVITNEDTLEKIGCGGPVLFPRFLILDPTYTYTVSAIQTAAGVADIMTHIFEFYFSKDKETYLQDALAEAVLKTCIKFGPIAIGEPENYEARANLMWASSMALNGIVTNGKSFDGFNHLTEHALSAIYDITHGVGLAILAPYWMEYVTGSGTAEKLAGFARNVWGVTQVDPFKAAYEGISKTRAFYNQLGLPEKLSQVGIGMVHIEDIVKKPMRRETLGNLKELSAKDVRNILLMAM